MQQPSKRVRGPEPNPFLSGHLLPCLPFSHGHGTVQTKNWDLGTQAGNSTGHASEKLSQQPTRSLVTYGRTLCVYLACR